MVSCLYNKIRFLTKYFISGHLQAIGNNKEFFKERYKSDTIRERQ